jgi:hypothetical protein
LFKLFSVSILTALTPEKKNLTALTPSRSWRLGGKHGFDLGQVNHVAAQGGTKLWRKQWNLHVWLDFGSYINTQTKEVAWEVEQKFDGMGEEVTSSFHNPNYPIPCEVFNFLYLKVVWKSVFLCSVIINFNFHKKMLWGWYSQYPLLPLTISFQAAMLYRYGMGLENSV